MQEEIYDIENRICSNMDHLLLPIRKVKHSWGSSYDQYSTIEFTPDQLRMIYKKKPRPRPPYLPRYLIHPRFLFDITDTSAVSIQSGFQDCDNGKKEYNRQIEGTISKIKNIIEFDDLDTVLSTSPLGVIGYYGLHVDRENVTRQFESILDIYVGMFDIIHKPNGLHTLLSHMRYRMNQCVPDTLVVAPTMLQYIRANYENFDEINVVEKSVYRTAIGKWYAETDLMTVPYTIGEFYPMEIESILTTPESFKYYRSSDRDIQIYNEETSRFEIVRFADAVKNCSRFNDNSGELWKVHSHDMRDMFVNSTTGRVVKRWKDMDAKYLPLEQIDNVVASICGNSIAQKIDFCCDDGICLIKDSTRFDELTAYLSTKCEPHRLYALWFLCEKVNMHSILSMHENNIYVPIDIILTRVDMTYNMSSIVCMKAGSETGHINMSDIEYKLIDDMKTKTTKGHMLYRGNSVVYKSQNILVAPNVFMQGYLDGGNIDFASHHFSHFSGGSVVPIMVPVGGRTINKKMIDVRGNHEYISDCGYSSSDYYAKLFNIDGNDIFNPATSRIDFAKRYKGFTKNSLCFRGEMIFGPSFSRYERGTSPLIHKSIFRSGFQ